MGKRAAPKRAAPSGLDDDGDDVDDPAECKGVRIDFDAPQTQVRRLRTCAVVSCELRGRYESVRFPQTADPGELESSRLP